MDRVFKQLIEQTTPQANPYIMNGLATHYIPYALWYIDHVFRSASNSFPSGLEYVSCEKCSVEEEYRELTKPHNNKRTYDLARSDLFMVKFHFKFNGAMLPPRYVLLPYVSKGGILHLSGTKYHITPILADKIFSPAYDSIFVKLLRDRVIFKRIMHSIKVDGVLTNNQVVWSQLYRKKSSAKNIPNTTRANTCMVHYLLAKFGISEMFQRFLGFVPYIGSTEVNPIDFPVDKWVIVESTRHRPDGFIGEFYEGTRCKIAVPKNKYDQYAASLITGVFYVIDHFPQLYKHEYKDDPAIWKIMLGHILFSGIFGEVKLHNDVSSHFGSLDNCLDNIIISELNDLGYVVKDFYDLLALVIENFNNWLLKSSFNNNNSLEGKKLDVLYYALLPVTTSIFTAVFELTKAAARKTLTAKDVTEILSKKIGPGPIFKLTSPNNAITTVSYSGDNLYPKITSLISEQESGPDAGRSGKSRIQLNARHRIHPTSAMFGSLHFLSKSNPTPNIHANMYMDVDLQSGSLKVNKKFADLMNETARKLEVNGYYDPDMVIFEDDGVDSD